MTDDDVRLRPWTEDDLAIELRNNVRDMTVFLGGPLGEDTVRRRHERFLRGQAEGTVWPFTVWTAAGAEPVGTAVYWQTDHRGLPVYECGWFVFPPYQRRG